MTDLSLKNLISATAVAILVAMALAELYVQCDHLVHEPWLAAALVNSCLAAFVLSRRWYTKRSQLPVSNPYPGRLPLWLAKVPARSYLPAIVVLGCTLTAIVVSRLSGGAESVPLQARQWAWVLWIPIIEEIVFRAGIGPQMRRWYGPLWGSYFSAFTFAFVHSLPTLSRIWEGQVGLPLGAFLLGLICEYMYTNERRLGPVVALHAACNATVVIFSWGDSRWLEWLGFLYL